MAIKRETSLQERIQTLIESKGGYVIKTHGDMTTEPGIPDLIFCYKGLFIAFEVKVDNNEPSRQQGIHCRNIHKASGIASIIWNIEQAKIVLTSIDRMMAIHNNIVPELIKSIVPTLQLDGIDDGKGW